MKEIIKQWIRYRQIKEWFDRYERLLMPVTLLVGVATDWVTFANINITASFVLLGIYFFLAGVAMLYLHAYEAGRLPVGNFFRYLRLATPYLIQFTFGALLSGSFIFYVFSGTVFVSWPLFAALVVLMVSNDVFRHHYLRVSVQVGVYFFILLSLTVILLPFVFHSLSPWMFVLSSFVSLALIAAYIATLGRAAPRVRERRVFLAGIVLGVTGIMNALYFFNIIPPIPLSLRDAALAHDIDRGKGGYALTVEQPAFPGRLLPGEIIHKQPGETVYVYTAVYAPQKFGVDVVHHWQYFDTEKKVWVSRDRLAFPITGGKERGYRGYSMKKSVNPGKWRVDVETPRGQVLGRVRFTVVEVSEAPELVRVMK